MITLPVAEVGVPYEHHLQEGIKIVGALPRGLSFDGTRIHGVASESATKIVQLTYEGCQADAVITSIRKLELNQASSQADFVRQLQAEVAKRKVWTVGMPSLTSQTLLELIGAVGAYFDVKIQRVKADCFQETAISAEGRRALAISKGIRLNRRLPSSCQVRLHAAADTTVPRFTQFNSGQWTLFNAEPLKLKAGTSAVVRLHEGLPASITTKGLGTPYQVLVLPEKNFSVSETHIHVTVDGVEFPRTMNGLWHLRNKLGFDDTTMVDGRARLAFGTSTFGGSPADKSEVLVNYIITHGDVGSVKLNGLQCPWDLTAEVLTELQGGMSEKPVSAYRYMDSFGTFGSALTKLQIETVVSTYPGIIDAQVSKDNGVSIVYHTAAGWTDADAEKLAAHLEEVVAYDGLEVVAAKPHAVGVALEVVGDAFLNKERVLDVVRELFKPVSNSIAQTIYDTDIIAAVKSVPGVRTLRGAKTYTAGATEYLTLASLSVEVEHVS